MFVLENHLILMNFETVKWEIKEISLWAGRLGGWSSPTRTGCAHRRQLEYKAAMRGGQIVVADRFFASSKTCSDCGYTIEALPLSVRHWTCPGCGAKHDRDAKAAINPRNHAVSSTGFTCGGEGAGCGCKTAAKPAPAKQEASS